MSLTRAISEKIDVDEHKYNFRFHPSICGNLCLSYATPEDLSSLKERTTYLRVFCKQDAPDSRAYIECFIREITRMMPSHATDAQTLFSMLPDTNFILLEINYVTIAHFFMFNLETKHIESGDVMLEWMENQAANNNVVSQP